MGRRQFLFLLAFFFFSLLTSIDAVFIRITSVVFEFLFVWLPAFQTVQHCSITPLYGMLFPQDSHGRERWVMFSELLPLLLFFLYSSFSIGIKMDYFHLDMQMPRLCPWLRSQH